MNKEYNLTTDDNAIVGSIVVTDVGDKDIRGISDATMNIGVILTRAPHPYLLIINVSFAGRMVVTQGSAGKNRHRVLVVGNSSESTAKMGVDVVGKVLIPDLCKRCAKFSQVRTQETFV